MIVAAILMAQGTCILVYQKINVMLIQKHKFERLNIDLNTFNKSW